MSQMLPEKEKGMVEKKCVICGHENKEMWYYGGKWYCNGHFPGEKNGGKVEYVEYKDGTVRIHIVGEEYPVVVALFTGQSVKNTIAVLMNVASKLLERI